VLPWRKASGELLSQRLFWPAWCAAGAMLLSVLLGGRGLAPIIAFGLGGFAAGAAGRQLVLATRRQGWRGLAGRTNGGMIVHLGVVVIAVALAASSSYSHHQELVLPPNQVASVGGHTVQFLAVTSASERDRSVTRAEVQVDGGQSYAPALSNYPNFGQPIATPSVRTTWKDDVYLRILSLPDTTGGPITLLVIVRPMILWLWIGGLIMALGTALAAFPGRRRIPTAPVSARVRTREAAVVG
jgi:cytochrome c-type biogenesis protein CcmF